MFFSIISFRFIFDWLSYVIDCCNILYLKFCLFSIVDFVLNLCNIFDCC